MVLAASIATKKSVLKPADMVDVEHYLAVRERLETGCCDGFWTCWSD